eukprot:5379784-Alexandrium_andersonii.AAC.1
MHTAASSACDTARRCLEQFRAVSGEARNCPKAHQSARSRPEAPESARQRPKLLQAVSGGIERA